MTKEKISSKIYELNRDIKELNKVIKALESDFNTGYGRHTVEVRYKQESGDFFNPIFSEYNIVEFHKDVYLKLLKDKKKDIQKQINDLKEQYNFGWMSRLFKFLTNNAN